MIKASFLKRNILAPARLFNALGARYINPLFREGMPFHPFMIDLEPTARCNLRCGFCQVPGWERAALPDMTVERFRALLKNFPHLTSIKITGMGEPFLNTDLCGMIRCANDRNIAVRVITNGTILDERLLKTLFESPPSWLAFSLDTADRGTYTSLRGADMFDQVVENIRRAAQLKRSSAARPTILIWCILTQKNIGGLNDLVRLAGTLGVDEIVCQAQLTTWGKGRFEKVIRHLEVLPLERGHVRILEEAARGAQKIGLRFRVNYDDIYSRRKPCPWPKTSVYVTCDGTVVPCCMIGDPRTVSMGSLQEESFASIWNSEKYRNLRRRLGRFDIPEFCARCYAGGKRVNPDRR
ncbi:MAG: radical SAM protein [Candidatus Aureabacteria bacterium]|nr:radical SAM protein [Candidatus Auribacterota bacterium]